MRFGKSNIIKNEGKCVVTMMQKIQKFGGAMFTPVLLFSFAGIMVGIGTLCTTEAVLGSLAAPTSINSQMHALAAGK